MEKLLTKTVKAGIESGALEPSSLERVSVDTTVQPKAIAHLRALFAPILAALFGAEIRTVSSYRAISTQT